MKKIDKKLMHCHNVMSDPASKQYKEAAAEMQDKEIQKRAAKVQTCHPHE